MGFSSVVSAVMEANNVKMSQLSSDSGISKAYLYELLRGDKRWNEDSIEKVSKALNINITFNIGS